MKSFVKSLTRANEKIAEEIDQRKQIQIQNQKRFRNTQKVARSALFLHPRKASSQPISHSVSSNIPKIEKIKPAELNNMKQQLNSNPFPYADRPTFFNYALPKQPCIGANRVYNSLAARRFVNNEIATFIDQAENPSPSISPLYAPSIDPILHIGRFNDLEINWNKAYH